jgi:eukaryotic-like serine/threonine-protein kinase
VRTCHNEPNRYEGVREVLVRGALRSGIRTAQEANRMQTMVSTAGSALAPAPSAELACTEPNEPDVLQPGDKAGPWIVERELGRGGMGAVYGVVHEEIGKRAALKVMHRRLVSGSSAERILLEAKVVNAVGHPNIVDIFETGTLADGRAYIVMERLEGMPLSYRADEGKILPDQVISILLQVCDALIAAHAANIVHRDLKLDNVFLIDNPDDPSSPRVKLLDWGIAKVISNDVRHTIEGQLVGTPQYLSPEQARGAQVTTQTDVYSLGVMAYELFLEQLPFEAETSAEIMAMHLRCTPPPPNELWPDIPPSLESLLLAMLAKDADARPTMLSVAHSLELVRADLETRMQSSANERPSGRIATPLPALRRASSRHDVANGFSPTLPAEWPETRRRWHVAIGALAIAASATMFLLTRDTERANAAAPKRDAVVEHAPVVDRVSTSDSDAVAAPVQAAATDILPAVAPARAEPPAIKPTVLRNSAATKHSQPSSRKVPVKPRRNLEALDPDGTLDPYQ